MQRRPMDAFDVLPVERFGLLTGPLNRLLRRHSFHIAVGFCILLLDIYSSPLLRFPILFVVPVALSAWFCSVRLAYLLAVLLSIGRFAIAVTVEAEGDLAASIINAVVRIAVLVFLAFLLGRILRMSSEIKILRGLLPTCMYCKRIRNEFEAWEPMEAYVARNSEAHFSQGLCPECMAQYHRQPLEPE